MLSKLFVKIEINLLEMMKALFEGAERSVDEYLTTGNIGNN